jgi:hypothetical protein
MTMSGLDMSWNYDMGKRDYHSPTFTIHRLGNGWKGCWVEGGDEWEKVVIDRELAERICDGDQTAVVELAEVCNQGGDDE